MKFVPFFLFCALVSVARVQAQTTPTPSPTSSPTPSLTIFDDAASDDAASDDAASDDSTVVSSLPPAPETKKETSAPQAIAPQAIAPQAIAPQAIAPQAIRKPTPATDRLLDVPQSAILQSQDQWLRADTSLNAVASRLGLSLPLPQARVVVFKSKRRLELWSGQTLVKVYRVALGNNPNGAKQKQHDSRTPEGRFYICTRNSATSAFHVFLGLSYPALPDAQRGKKTGLISSREYAMIRNRLSSRGAPLWETRLGGWVGIHGGTEGAFARKQMNKRGRTDWTAGCIAVTDREIEEIHRATVLGTPVWVRP